LLKQGNKYRLILVEDHVLLRAGLRGLLEQENDIEVVAEADNGRDGARLVAQLNPHIVLMDLSMPGSNGMEAIAEVRRNSPNTKVLVLTQHKIDEYIYGALKAGANGYILKTTVFQELLNAVRTVLAGKSYLTPEISAEIILGMVGNAGKQSARPALDKLTHRERQVLQLVAEGRSSKFIADYLCVSVKTVDKHRANLRQKLGLRTASSLVSFAIAMGIIPGYGQQDPEPVPPGE
jgi:DNA-binding NarL/FixJ family response regulator